MSKIKEFFKGAFEDMKESAKAQHEVDKANFAARLSPRHSGKKLKL